MSNEIEYFVDKRGRQSAKFNNMVFIKESSGYYRIKTNWRKEIPNSYRLHRAVYEFYNGPISEGMTIHHKDENKDNNDISNLELISNSDHVKWHQEHLSEETIAKRTENWNNVHKAASEWHKNNPLSHEVHSKSSKKGWENRPYYKHICIQCGKEFETKEKECKFCSGQCKNDYACGYSLLDIESIEYIGEFDVYNMEVKKHHNYAIDGGIILHNCDSLRYGINTIMKKRIEGRV